MGGVEPWGGDHKVTIHPLCFVLGIQGLEVGEMEGKDFQESKAWEASFSFIIPYCAPYKRASDFGLE